MFSSVSPRKKTYEKIIEQILDLIKSGELKKGDKLPSERKLCEMLGVGRTSLKQAISSLSALGIIESLHGTGNYLTRGGNVDLVIPLTAQFFLGNCKVTDMVAIRYMIETQVALVAAGKISEQQLEALGAIVLRMKDLKDDSARVRINFEFHKFLVDILENELLSSIYDCISDMISHQVLLADGVNFYQNHLDLLEAFAARDAARAHSLMKVHFEAKYADMQDNFFKYFNVK